MNIAILSGELSGDLLGAALAQALRRHVPEVTLWGLGSGAMRAAGVELLADSAAWGAISVTEAVGKVPGLLLRVRPMVLHALKQRRPDVVVLIDFGAFNVRAARAAKALGLKVLYYFPPGAWRRTGSQGAELARITDTLATPFPWSAERFQALGANAVCVGHPLLERAHALMSRSEFAAQFGMDASQPILGLLPGSRHHEIEHLMPTLLDAARLIYRAVPNAQFVVGVAPTISPETMAKFLSGNKELRDRLGDIWHEFAQEAGTKVWKPVVARTASALSAHRGRMLVTAGGVLVPEESLQREMEARRRSEHLRARAEQALPPIVLAKGLTYDVMAHSDVLLTCSGTATLEAAVFTTPMVILYRGSKVMAFEYKLRGLHKKLRFIGLPNILADRAVVPELIQEAATPEAIAEHTLALLNDIETRQRVKRDLRAVAEMLGTPGASERTAQLVLELARRGESG
jgi:lipid-A-disaccharide synthase